MTREDAIKVLRTESVEIGGNAVSVCRFWEALDMAVKALDAVPVVRCEKCVHYEMGVCLKIYDDGAASRYAWQERKPDDFCSYGEKRRDKDGKT